MTLAAIVGGVALFGIGCFWLGSSVRVRYRRFQVQLEDERCGLETAPIYCGRIRK